MNVARWYRRVIYLHYGLLVELAQIKICLDYLAQKGFMRKEDRWGRDFYGINLKDGIYAIAEKRLSALDRFNKQYKPSKSNTILSFKYSHKIQSMAIFNENKVV